MQEVPSKYIKDEKTGQACPECGKPLVVKTGRFGKFISCSGYPKCEYSHAYQVKTGAKCPQCGGDLMQRLNKKGKTFYGCANYPACSFAINLKPLPAPCPKCGGLLILRQTQVICSKCEYKDMVQEDKAVNIPLIVNKEFEKKPPDAMTCPICNGTGYRMVKEYPKTTKAEMKIMCSQCVGKGWIKESREY